MTIQLLIEGEEILHRYAFAKQSTRYRVINPTNGRECSLPKGTTKKQATEWVAKGESERGITCTIEQWFDPEPLSWVLRDVKRKLDSLAALGELTCFLNPQDGSNFRNFITDDYKKGRPAKPIHYQACRNWLIENYNCKVMTGYEADDGLSLHQTDETIIASIDKDLNMVAGKHLNWMTMHRYLVPEGLGYLDPPNKNGVKGYGLIQFYAQLLQGDQCDNIKGIYNIGPAKAYKMLSEMTTEQEAFNVVKQEYISFYKEEAMTKLKLAASLLWMCKKEGVWGEHYLQEQGFI